MQEEDSGVCRGASRGGSCYPKIRKPPLGWSPGVYTHERPHMLQSTGTRSQPSADVVTCSSQEFAAAAAGDQKQEKSVAPLPPSRLQPLQEPNWEPVGKGVWVM